MKKYTDVNNEYYSQEKSYYNSEDPYKSYMEKNILPYNDQKGEMRMSYDDLKEMLMKKIDQELFNYKQNLTQYLKK